MTLPAGFDVVAAYDRYGSQLLGFAVNVVRDRALAEDCVQEVMVRAWKARDRYDPDRASERTWLFAILRNVLVDAQRAASRQPRRISDAQARDAPSDAPDPLERLALAEGLAKLSDEHRDVVLAVHVVGRSYSEISSATGVPVATLRTRAFYALRALRRHLDDVEERDV